MTKNSARVYLIIFAAILLFAVQSRLQLQDAALPQGLLGEQQKLTASDGITEHYFGASVALDGDTALVSRKYDQIGENYEQGSVFVYVRSGNTWTEQQKLVASDGESEDGFGFSIAIEGDTALIGAIRADAAVPNHGAVYVFVRNGNTWTEQQKLTASDGITEHFFGTSVVLDGDTALIGSTSGITKGAAYVFARNSGIWTEQQILSASDGEVGDSFGASVALDGDTALIGAFRADVEGSFDQGSAYVFERSGGVWAEQQKLVPSDGVTKDYFGRGIAVDGDTILIGAEEDDTLVPNAGSAYIYVRNGSTWVWQAKLIPDDTSAALFGYSVALDGDTALVGVLIENHSGSAYVFVRNQSTWTLSQKLKASDAETYDYFGYSAALDGDTALVGKIGEHGWYGGAYVFVDEFIATPTPTYTPGGPTETPTITPTPTNDSTQLMVNGDFELLGSDGKPDITPWIVKNASGDKPKCNKDKDGNGLPDKLVAHIGNCAFQFKNVVGEIGKLEQTIDLSSITPEIGNMVFLTAYAQGKGGAKVKMKGVVKYADGTKTKISRESDGSENYTEFSTLGYLTSTDIVKLTVSFKGGQATGKVYLDYVRLFYSVIEEDDDDFIDTLPLPSVETVTPEARLSGSTH